MGRVCGRGSFREGEVPPEPATTVLLRDHGDRCGLRDLLLFECNLNETLLNALHPSLLDTVYFANSRPSDFVSTRSKYMSAVINKVVPSSPKVQLEVA